MKSPVFQHRSPAPARQRGVMLLEAMIAILIFSTGLLAVAGLQAAAAANVADTQFRSEASLLADSILGQMYADSTANGTLVAKYSSSSIPAGAEYLAWVARVQDAVTGLPGSTLAGNEPTIVIADDNTVTVTLFWAPRANVTPNTHIVVAQIQ